MTRKCDRLFPVTYTWLNSLYNDRRTENSSIKDRTDRTIRTLVHLLQIIFIHTCMVRCDCRTFYCNPIFFCSFSSVDCYLIICLISNCASMKNHWIYWASSVFRSINGRRSSSLIIFQRILVISSPSISTSGVVI